MVAKTDDTSPCALRRHMTRWLWCPSPPLPIMVRGKPWGAMLIATFGPTTEWAGRTITRNGETFILENHGQITASNVMEYDEQGLLVWVSEGTRAWVGSRAKASDARRIPDLRSSPASGWLEAAAKHHAAGNHTEALHALRLVRSGYRLDPTEALTLRELASSIRATGNPQFLARCDQLVAIADAPAAQAKPHRQISALSIIGALLVIIGLIVVASAIGTDVSVPTGDYGERVNNIGLMNDQHNAIIGGLVVAVIGGVMVVIPYIRRGSGGSPRRALVTDERKCPYCAETIKAEAIVCRFCNRDVSQGTAG